MQRPSLTTVLSVCFLAYMANSMWSLAQLYIPPTCPKGDKTCIANSLTDSSQLSLILFTTTKSRPSMGGDLKFLKHLHIKVGDELTDTASIKFPKSVVKNGTMYLAVFAVPKVDASIDQSKADWWRDSISGPRTSYSLTRLTEYSIPVAETFNLLGGETEEEVKAAEKGSKNAKTVDRSRPVTHLRSKVILSVMNDQVTMSIQQIPPELGRVITLTGDRKTYLPIIYVDELTMRMRDLRIVNATDSVSDIEIVYRPISFGRLRLFLQFYTALSSMHKMGFTEKDTDEVKGIFADTNLALLLVTFGVSAIHLLFDFLAFKNDVNFWRGKKTVEGLSRKTILWRAFSQSVIFFYLMDEETSMLVLIPAGVGALIEIWKVTKALHIKISWSTGLSYGQDTADEASTAQLDDTAMKYLSWVLYPLCLVGAIYSLLYTPHKSWYSWTIQTTVNGVYAFGFMFMLPQLFLNYKLKSVAHLPWRAFMYKAFNTFIDDLFAFIITMPTAHRVACFRDDIVFLIYLYQRYLYPVDPNRIDTSVMMDEDSGSKVQAAPTTPSDKKTN